MQRKPQVLRVETDLCDFKECGGLYHLLPGKAVSGAPVWSRDNQYWLFMTPDGLWMFGDCEPSDGCIIVLGPWSTNQSRTLMPHEVRQWSCFNGGFVEHNLALAVVDVTNEGAAPHVKVTQPVALHDESTTNTTNNVAALRDEVTALKKDLQEALAALRGTETHHDEVTALKGDLQEALASVRGTEALHDEVTALKGDLQEALAALQGAEALHDEVTALKKDLQEALASVRGAEDGAKSSHKELSRLREELKSMKEQEKNIQDTLHQEVTSLKQACSTAAEEKRPLEMEFSHMQEALMRLTEVECKIASANEDISSLQKEVMRLKEQEYKTAAKADSLDKEPFHDVRQLRDVTAAGAPSGNKTAPKLQTEEMAQLAAKPHAQVQQQQLLQTTKQDIPAMSTRSAFGSWQQVDLGECAEATAAPARTTILKFKHQDEIYRMRLQELSMEEVIYAVEQVVGVSFDAVKARYRDIDADLCLLCAATFADFVATAGRYCHDCRMFQLEVSLPKSSIKGSVNGNKASIEHEDEPEEASDEQQNEECDNDAEATESQHDSESSFQLEGGGRCFVRRTLLHIAGPGKELRHVQSLQVGDQVLSSTGRNLQVASVQKHVRELRQLVTLKTTQAEVMVTMDHRIVMPDQSSKLAKELVVGDKVMCGGRAQRLTKVMQFEERAELVEVRFHPDEPVETLMAPHRGILTKGAYLPVAVCAKGPLGPFVVEYLDDKIQTGQAQRRARSAER